MRRRALGAARSEPAHIAVVAAREIIGKVAPRVVRERGRRKADGVEAQVQRRLADRRFGVRAHIYPRPR